MPLFFFINGEPSVSLHSHNLLFAGFRTEELTWEWALESCYLFSNNEAFRSPKGPQIFFTQCCRDAVNGGSVKGGEEWDLFINMTLQEYRTNASIYYLKIVHFVSPFHWTLAIFHLNVQTPRKTLQLCTDARVWPLLRYLAMEGLHTSSEGRTQNGWKMEKPRHDTSIFLLCCVCEEEHCSHFMR